MPTSGTTFGWQGVWFGAWFGPPLGGSIPPPPPSGIGTIITGGYGGSQVIVQGYGATGETTAITGSGGMQWGGGIALIVPASGGMSWGGTIGGAVPVAYTFLAALVKMLRSNSALTTAIGGPRIYSTWPGPKTPTPFVVIEDYIESQPGETIEHNLNTVVFATYAPDKATATAVQTALTNSVDSPAQNKFSTRVPLQWSTGTEESSWRQPTLPPMRMKMQKSATDLWCWKIQYDFNILPNFQV